MKKYVSIAVLALMAAACSKKEDAPTPPLGFAPADTAYVFGNLEQTPEAFAGIYEKWFASMSDGLRQSIQRAQEKTSLIEDPAKAQQAKAVLELLQTKVNEGPAGIGMNIRGLVALYEINALPVLRFELSDTEKFKGFIKDLETRLGKPFTTAKVGDQSYWSFKPDDSDQVEVLLAVVGKHAVATINTPSTGVTAEQLLGLKKPEKSILDAGDLQQINKEYGLQPYGTLLVKSQALAQKVLGQPGKDSWISALAAKEGKALSDICRTEITAIIGKAPRLVGGYTKLDKTDLDMAYTLELEPALAQSLAGLAAPVAGLGSNNGQGVELGMGLHLDKLADFLQAQAKAITAAPFQCEQLQDLNETAAQAPQQLASLRAAASWVTGFRLNLSELDLETATAKGTVLIASPTPVGLISMAQSFVPDLAQLDLSPGAEPQQIDASFLQMLGAQAPGEIWVATGEKAVGIGIGPNGKEALQKDLKAAEPSPAPLLHTSFAGKFYADLMEKTNQAMPEELMAEDTYSYIMWPIIQSAPAMYKSIDYMNMNYLLTSKGLEIHQKAKMQP